MQESAEPCGDSSGIVQVSVKTLQKSSGQRRTLHGQCEDRAETVKDSAGQCSESAGTVQNSAAHSKYTDSVGTGHGQCRTVQTVGTVHEQCRTVQDSAVQCRNL